MQAGRGLKLVGVSRRALNRATTAQTRATHIPPRLTNPFCLATIGLSQKSQFNKLKQYHMKAHYMLR